MLHARSIKYLKTAFVAIGLYMPFICHGLVVGTTDTAASPTNAPNFNQSPFPTGSYNPQAVATGQLANKPAQTKPATGTVNNGGGRKVVAGEQKTSATDKKQNQTQLEAVPQTPEDIAEIMIETTNEVYKDRCACPYNGDKDGFECGVESLYYKPGGHRIPCYEQDFRGQQFIFYRKNAN